LKLGGETMAGKIKGVAPFTGAWIETVLRR